MGVKQVRLIIYTILLLMLATPFLMYSYSGLSSYEADQVGIGQALAAPEPKKPEYIPKPEVHDAFVEILDRLRAIKEFCRKYHLGKYAYLNGTNDLLVKDPPSPQYSYFFLNEKRRIGWCPVYKAGSTSWLHNMMLLKGFSESDFVKSKKQLSIWAREVYGEPEPGPAFEDAFKILVVRHPFERILSAYRDKLSNSTIGLEHGTAHFHSKYGKQIVSKFRTNTSITQIEPTFEEFVRYLLKTDLILYSDDHWLPAYYSCTPCRVQFNAIAKLETYSRDQVYIIQVANLSSILKPQWQHRTRSQFQDSSQYFSQLTKTQIHELYQKYWLDFNMFGYSHDEYLKYGRDSG